MMLALRHRHKPLKDTYMETFLSQVIRMRTISGMQEQGRAPVRLEQELGEAMRREEVKVTYPHIMWRCQAWMSNSPYETGGDGHFEH